MTSAWLSRDLPHRLAAAGDAGGRRRRRAVLRGAVALLAAAACMGARVSRLVPPAEFAPPVSASGQRVAVSLAGAEVGFEPLDAAGRAAFLKERGAWDGPDLFGRDARAAVEAGVHPIDVKQFLVFRFDLTNRSRGEIHLDPASLRCVVDDTPHFAMEYTAYYSHFINHRRLDEKAMERLKRGFLTEPITLPPGKSVRRLVAFQDVAGRFKRFHLEVVSLLIDAESRGAVVPFDVVRDKVKKGKAR
jgi:hypothetical protein